MYLRIPWRFLASASEIGIREDSDKHIRASGESQTSDKLKESLDALPWQPIQNHLSQNFSTYFWQHHDFINLWLPRLLNRQKNTKSINQKMLKNILFIKWMEWTLICTRGLQGEELLSSKDKMDLSSELIPQVDYGQNFYAHWTKIQFLV